MKNATSIARLQLENLIHRGTGGRSEENRGLGFRPAFLDFATQRIYLSCFRNGMPAPIHVLDSLPEGVVGKPTLVSGFVRNGFFYTRRAAARAVASWK
jgi:hypothetical protein